MLLAGATLSSVRSASRAAAAAERSILVGMRPVLLTSRMDDRAEKVFWIDEHWARVQGGHAYAQVVDGNLYMAVSLRNSGQGLAVLQSWTVTPDRLGGGDQHAELRRIPAAAAGPVRARPRTSATGTRPCAIPRTPGTGRW